MERQRAVAVMGADAECRLQGQRAGAMLGVECRGRGQVSSVMLGVIMVGQRAGAVLAGC